MSARVSLPHVSFQHFGPEPSGPVTKMGATAEAARPKGEAMLDTITGRTAPPRSNPTIVSAKHRDGIDRAASHAEAWLKSQTERAQSGIFSEEFTITPQMAQLLLRKNPDNRNLKKTRIAEIRADLEAGRYVLNGEPIIVSRDGLLNDGQHRLIAGMESGVSFRSLVVFGVSRSSRLTLDQGNARTVADYLDMEGAQDQTKVMAAVARMLWQFKKQGSISKGSVKNGVRFNSPTKAEIMGVCTDCEREISRGMQSVKQTSRMVGSLSFVVFCHIILSRADETMGAIFIERLLDGANLTPESPIFVLRARFINDPRMRQPERFEAVVRAWNALRTGKPLTKIQIMGSVPKLER